ncbi:hypothetical protein [Stakelama marina]|uniref:hypothetical protein n=1 Tax=Stakelama marina TaxID=2826939 RepID=UPI003D361B51
MIVRTSRDTSASASRRAPTSSSKACAKAGSEALRRITPLPPPPCGGMHRPAARPCRCAS